MEAINSFKELFLEVWNEGIFVLNASEIIIGFIILYGTYIIFSYYIIIIVVFGNKNQQRCY